MSATEPSEKEHVYTELARVQAKCERLRGELRALKEAASARENATLRKEAHLYRKALSHLLYRLNNGGDTDETSVRAIVEAALALRGLKVRDRRKVEALRDTKGEG